MVECIFTLDYEIYGNGEGSLKELVYEPSKGLMAVFEEAQARFVAFVEAAEMEKIDQCRTDDYIDAVNVQIRELYERGFEIGLHLHPQWYNGTFQNGKWILDNSEYNLCTLDEERIAEVVERSLSYLRKVLGDPTFVPLSFRAGNWLFQPTKTAAAVIAKRGIKIDSSVFQGGVQRAHQMDYRPAKRNGFYWRFSNDVNEPDPAGAWIEMPIYTEMVPFWKMMTSKRVGLQHRAGGGMSSISQRLARLGDLIRFRYPLKLDFCRMTLDELTRAMVSIIEDDKKDPSGYRPVVAIGHTKDLIDLNTVKSFISFLRCNKVAVCTFRDVYPKVL